MSLKIEKDQEGIVRISFNTPFIRDMYDFHAESQLSEDFLSGHRITIEEYEESVKIQMPLELMDHIMGLGEKALPVERRRTRVEFWNYDSYAYNLKTDPLYVSIPFFLKISQGKATGFFVNYGGRTIMDFGQEIYDKITITVPSRNFELYIFPEGTPADVSANFMKMTGRPFTLPEWSLEHQICRYSYYPEKRVLDIIHMYQKVFGKESVGSVYLDIDYMKDYVPFTIDGKKFSNPEKFIEECHNRGIKVIPIIDPGLKLDQKDETFIKGLGNYVETSKGEIFSSSVWPGTCAFPDFLMDRAREFWSSKVREFIKNGFDGIWLDMNEPSMNSKSRTIDEDAVHNYNGSKISHTYVHNYYSYFESMATKKALGEDKFILSRSGFAGSQRYAAIWSGDGNGNFEGMALQIPLLSSLSISGVPYVGCDLGGFLNYSDPELLLRFYQMALFFPVYRNHKSKTENDQELYIYNSFYTERFREILRLRHSIVPHLLWKARLAEENFEPIIRPLAFNFPNEDGLYQIDDQYMVGDEIMIAPIVQRGMDSRKVFLPSGRWYNLQTGEMNLGNKMVNSGGDMPIYLRENHLLLTRKGIVVFGNIKEKVFYEGKWLEIEKIKDQIKTSENTKERILDCEKERVLISDLI
ncbi:TIM-barrel domain-containing protein [Cuniculiplasma sp. SKW3]|uniref:TIM-barrel domain-containing protein n=1 Tax=Cuniculiplasma sp. SKW3 TaxID=3400170 RepID=UPI003FCFC2FE